MSGPYYGGTPNEGTRMCVGCGRQISTNFNVCPYCSKPVGPTAGAQVQSGETKMCVGCGMQIQANWSYCPYCGKKHA